MSDEIDTGPLNKDQLQGLARDQLSALRNTAEELCISHHVNFDGWLMDRIEFQLCGPEPKESKPNA